MNLLLHLPQFLAQASDLDTQPNYGSEAGGAAAAAAGGVILLVELVLIVLMIIGMWKVFTKAGKPGWAAIIPIYNIIVLWQITGKPGWVLALAIIPCTSIIGVIMLGIGVAERFGKSAGYGIGLGLLPFIFYPMLGFSDARYLGPEGAPGAPLV
jgi:hypothetical protein